MARKVDVVGLNGPPNSPLVGFAVAGLGFVSMVMWYCHLEVMQELTFDRCTAPYSRQGAKAQREKGFSFSSQPEAYPYLIPMSHAKAHRIP